MGRGCEVAHYYALPEFTRFFGSNAVSGLVLCGESFTLIGRGKWS